MRHDDNTRDFAGTLLYTEIAWNYYEEIKNEPDIFLMYISFSFAIQRNKFFFIVFPQDSLFNINTKLHIRNIRIFLSLSGYY